MTASRGASDLASLSGLGPRSSAALARLGIVTAADLARADAVALYWRLKAADPRTTLNMLWGLVAAQSGLPWQQVARERRTELLLRLDDLARAEAAKARPFRQRGSASRRPRS